MQIMQDERYVRSQDEHLFVQQKVVEAIKH